MAQSFLARGFAVDISSYRDYDWTPPAGRYAVIVAARTHMERLAAAVGPSCVKIAHLDKAHWLTHNALTYVRLHENRVRHGIAMHLKREVESNWALEHADLGCVLGNEFTIDSYRYAGKPVHRVPISTTRQFDWPAGRDFDACRHSYLWFGSGGFVHKGLDRVIEAFLRLPAPFRLRVCGPLNLESNFLQAYERELADFPRIEMVGWTDVASSAFREILTDTLAVVYPSASEGGGGSVVTCMHGGLIPVVTRETSVDTPGFGVVLGEAGVEEIMSAVQALSARPAAELEAEARRARDYARAHHTRATFGAAYDRFVDEVVLPELARRS
jgi:glycosyltransferase involved in cell wall biosynthesis